MGVYFGNYCYVMIIVLVLGAEVRSQSLKNGYYSTSCPKAESIVRSTVESHFDSDPTISPGLLRLHFHDCFVQGCDGSVLIKGKSAEQAALASTGLRGFEVIDDAKARLESVCPGVVSCADILALAARDAVDLSSGPSWTVPTGRKDGRISLASEASNLPSPLDSVAVQKQKFQAKGLDTHDLVTLLGAHTIGQTDCQFFRYRLYNFTVTGNSDPTISPSFLTQLKTLCPPNGDGSKRVALDIGSPSNFDVSFFKNLRDGNGILESDQRLWSDSETNDVGKAVKYSCSPAVYHDGVLRIPILVRNSGIKIPAAPSIAHRQWTSSACAFHFRLSGSDERPRGSNPKSPGRLPSSHSGGVLPGNQIGLSGSAATARTDVPDLETAGTFNFLFSLSFFPPKKPGEEIAAMAEEAQREAIILEVVDLLQDSKW